MRTEKEKMIAGESYFSGDAELAADRKHARKMMRAINQESDGKKRSELLKKLLAKQHKTYIWSRMYILITVIIFM